jgi:hypothetical protein
MIFCLGGWLDFIPDVLFIFSCILANGTNYGLYKMANISDRSMGELRSVDSHSYTQKV